MSRFHLPNPSPYKTQWTRYWRQVNSLLIGRSGNSNRTKYASTLNMVLHWPMWLVERWYSEQYIASQCEVKKYTLGHQTAVMFYRLRYTSIVYGFTHKWYGFFCISYIDRRLVMRLVMYVNGIATTFNVDWQIGSTVVANVLYTYG